MRHHMQWNIRGALKRTDKELEGLMQWEDGKFLTGAEAREHLTECLAKGWRLFPVGDCEGFDYQTGCPGHPSEND